jgi:hypothetical protein
MAQRSPLIGLVRRSEQFPMGVVEAAESQIPGESQTTEPNLVTLEKYKFYDDKVGHVYDPERMPFDSTTLPQKIGKGARGSVYKTKILHGHFRGKDSTFAEVS